MSEEVKLILEMVQNGKISASEAEELIDNLPAQVPAKSNNQKFIRIHVQEDEKSVVSVNIPLALAEVGLKFIPADQLDLKRHDISINDILSLVESGAMGELVNVDTVDKGKHVKVRIAID